ncbi:acyl carrier protein [Clostridia bacterium]|nr:acyl carrier protein [Clostridia bacterium]
MTLSKDEIKKKAEEREDLCKQLKTMIVEQLDLDIEAEFIAHNQPIFLRGLELDSIDSLELAVGFFERFGVSVSDDNNTVFSSINSMADFIEDQRAESGE